MKFEINLKFKNMGKWYVDKRKYSVFNFYAIRNKNRIKQIADHVDITITGGTDPNNKITMTAIPRTVTESTLDQMASTSSLDEISIAIPFEWWKECKKNPIEFNCKYTIYKNIIFSKDAKNREHNFVVIPRNYGKTIKKCLVEIMLPINKEFVIEGFCINTENEYLKIMDFKHSTIVSKEQKVFSPFMFEFIPDMKYVYFWHITQIFKDIE